MNSIRLIHTFIIIASLAASQLYPQAKDSAPPIPAEEVPEVLNQGPIHEAFAQPVDLVTEPGIISPQEPPDDITEEPADEKPESSDYIWIPGYWAWDTERSDYVWVSGCWRIAPADMAWIPGYWSKVSDGWQWVSGFWISTTQVEQIQYLSQPPEISDTTPPSTDTETENIWVPPCYYWRPNGYTLRAGYWLQPREDWIWIPSHYSWTPHGYVFVPGYWDYALDTRGVLYAPIYFPPKYHRPRNYTCSLGVVVNIGNLDYCLFTYPRYCHYYFGDYYSDSYISIGILPWYEFKKRHHWHDPIYEHKRCHYRRSTPHWSDHIRNEYKRRWTDAKRRPQRTYREVKSHLLHTPKQQRNNFRYVEPVQKYTERNNSHFKFSKMKINDRREIFGHADKVNSFRQKRRHIESHRAAPTIAKPSSITYSSDRKISVNRSLNRTSSKHARPDDQNRIRTTTNNRTTPDRHSRTQPAPPANTRRVEPDRTNRFTPNKTRPTIPARTQQAKPTRAQPNSHNKTSSDTRTKARPATPTRTRQHDNKTSSAKKETSDPGLPGHIDKIWSTKNANAFHDIPAKSNLPQPESNKSRDKYRKDIYNKIKNHEKNERNNNRIAPPAKARRVEPPISHRDTTVKTQQAKPAAPSNTRRTTPTRPRSAAPTKARQPNIKTSTAKIKAEKPGPPKQIINTKTTNSARDSRSTSTPKTPSQPESKSQPEHRKDSDKKNKKRKSGNNIGKKH